MPYLFSSRGLLTITLLVHQISFEAVAQTSSGATFLALLDSAQRKSSQSEWKQAANLWEQVVDENPVNGLYYASLAQAHFNSNNYEKAIIAYKKQLELGAGNTYNVAYNIGRSYAMAGNKKQAFEWVRNAFGMGFHNFRFAQTDTVFSFLHNNPEFRKIVALPTTDSLDRIQKWKYDLEILQREIDRKAYKGSPRFHADTVKTSIDRLVKNLPRLTDPEIILEVVRIMETVGDGHSWAMPPGNHPDFRSTLPLQFYKFKEGTFIIAGDPKYRALLGSKVIEYEGISVEKLYSIFEPYISRDNAIGIIQRVPYLMRSPIILKTLKYIKDPKEIKLKVIDISGREQMVTVVADQSQPNIWNIPYPTGWISLPQTLGSEIPLYLGRMDKAHWWQLIEGGTVYCQVNRIRNERDQSFAQLAERLSKFLDSTNAERLILDFRWNNGGNTGLVIPFIDSIISNSKINQRGNLFVIIGRRTYSAAQNTATFLERFTNAIFVGEPSGSSPNFVGEEDPLELPYSKMIVNVSDLLWQSSWPQDKRTWIAPTLYAPPTFESYKANRDPALEAIRNYPRPQRAGF